MKSKPLLITCLVLAVVCIGYFVRSNLNRPPKQPNVLFLLLDTLRADHLGVFGYERDTSPTIDAFARENLFFKYVITAAPWTPPSVASMLTGLYPPMHGVMPPNSREEARKAMSKLSDDKLTLPEIFKIANYQTGAISPNPWIKEEFGFNQGFDTFQFYLRANAEKITTEGIELIKRLQANGKPWFVYLHYLDPHDPYNPPPEFASMYSGGLKDAAFPYSEKTLKRIGLYDGEIRYLDSQLARLFKFLKDDDLYDDLKIVLVGDHGEQFTERGDQGHGFRLHTEEVHVPLVIRNGDAHRETNYTVSTVDIFPTVLEMAGIGNPTTNSPAISLLDQTKSQARVGVLSEIARKYEQRAITNPQGQKLIIDYKLGETDANGAPIQVGAGVFDRNKDYYEHAAIDDPELLKSMLIDFNTLHKQYSSGTNTTKPQTGVTDDTIEQLKSLGYLQ